MPATSKTKYVVMASWDDAAHLSAEEKAELWEGIPPHQRDARSKGIPQLGSGAIYPIVEERIIVDDFEIPRFWPRAYALDVGWNCTAAVWGAWDRQSDIVYLYSCYKQGQADPPVHVDAIQSRGDWIPGVIDPAARGRSQRDGNTLFDDYISMGLNLDLSANTVEAGIHAIFRRMVSGRFMVFKSMQPWFEEYRLYRRDEKGKVVKENDHLMDCTRYLILSGMSIAVDELAVISSYSREFKEKQTGNVTTGY